MNETLNKGLIFAAGAAIGSFVTWKLVKSKYAQIAQEEIDSVKDWYASRNGKKSASHSEETEQAKIEETEEEDEEDDVEQDRIDYQKLVQYSGYAAVSAEKEEKEERAMAQKKPYVIPPEEFGDCDYPTISLSYYEDGVLANEQNKMIKNVEELVGEDSLTHFGEYEEDSVFVRNDKIKADYEILKVYRNYSEVS